VDRASPSQWFSESLRSGALGFPNIRGGVLSKSPVGSSASNSVGSLTMANAMPTRCYRPPESCLGNPSRSLEHASTMLRGFRVKLPKFRPNRNGRRIRTPTMVTHGQRDYRAMVHKHSTCSKRTNPECLPKCCISRTMPHVRGSDRTPTSSTKPLTPAGMSGRRSDVSFPASKRPIRRRTLLAAAVDALFEGAGLR
jgi:hypothetical protein